MASRSDLSEVCSTMVRWLRQPPTDRGLSTDQWWLLRRASLVHGVAPELAARLAGCAWVDLETRHWLDLQRELNRSRVELLLSEASTILGVARDRGVEVMPMKGVALAADPEVHDPARRPMADIDLLVRPHGVRAMAEVLEDLGYRLESTKAKHSTFFRPDNRRVVSSVGEHPHNPRPVEVHVTVGETFARRRWDLTERSWATARAARLGSVLVAVPSPDLQWMHLVLHTAWQFLHGGGRLIQLLDLVRLTPRVSDLAPALASLDARAPYLALSLAEHHFPGTMPADALSELARRAGASAVRLAASLDLLSSSHLNPGRICKLRRLIRFHRSSATDLGGLLVYVLLPRIGEMHINHDRLPPGRRRRLAYPMLWLWHVANLTVRS